jgi:hypothetical protein
MTDGVVFWGVEQNDQLVGVMGIQDKGDVALIRHAYVKTEQRNSAMRPELERRKRLLTCNSMREEAAVVEIKDGKMVYTFTICWYEISATKRRDL